MSKAENKQLDIRPTKTEIENKREYFKNMPFVDDTRVIENILKLAKVENKDAKQNDQNNKLINKIAMLYGLDNGLWLANLGHEKYYQTLVRMRGNIVKQYDCKTAIELMLADRIVANYWYTMRSDTILNHSIENKDGSFSMNQLKINMVREFNNGIERADRQLNADIMLLKELKQPKLNIKVNTENAYIAQNQQVINKDPQKQVETDTVTIKAI